MGENSKNADLLTFDFSGLPRRWSREWLETTAELSGIAALGVMKPPDGLPEEDRAKLELEMHIAIANTPELIGRRDRLLCQVLVNVPRKWVHEDAPNDLDWNDPESLDWILEEKFPEVINAVANRRAKN
jgi:hypothetical protein